MRDLGTRDCQTHPQLNRLCCVQQEQQAWREEVEFRAKAQADLALERMARQMDGRIADVQREAAGRAADLQTQVGVARKLRAPLPPCSCGWVTAGLQTQAGSS